MKDFDEATGKLVNVPTSTRDEVTLLEIKPAVNPLGLAPTGSAPLRYNGADGFRTFLAGFSVYGVAMACMKGFVFAGAIAPTLVPHYGPEIAAFTAAGVHLAMAVMADNTPR